MGHTLFTRLIPSHRHQAPAAAGKVCGHTRHVGWCTTCQREQLARWDAQLAAVSRARSAQ